KPNRLPEFGGHVAAVDALLTEKPAEDVVRLRVRRIGCKRLTKTRDGTIPIGRGKRWGRGVQRGFELPERLGGLAPAKKRNAEIHVDGGGRRPGGGRGGGGR